LISACDCFVSLHRSEGFGRGPAEAMYLGRLALATGWSGNVDYMGANGPLAVRYNMIDVKPNEYPHGEGQQWGEPDVDHAVELAIRLLDDMAFRSKTAESGMRYVHQHFSNRAVGLRSLDGLNMIDSSPVEAAVKRPRKGTTRSRKA
jgi:glycosyltransferase involved in cell wall biosynthesis